jgi:hypothetical protein
MDIVVSGGPDPDRPLPPPKQRDQTSLLLQLIAVGVFVGAAAAGYTGWTSYQSQRDGRLLNCLYLTEFNGVDDGAPDFDDLSKAQQRLIDRFGCDYPGR